MNRPGKLWLPSLMAACALLAACGKKEAPAPAAGPAVSASPAVADAGVNRPQLEGGPLEPTCSVESVVALADQKRYAVDGATYSIPRGLAVKVIGFATQKSKGQAMGAFTAYLASTQAVYKVQGQTLLERPDVVAFFKAPGMLNAGFHLDVDLKDVPAGDYAVFLRPGDGPACPTHHTIRIQ